MSVHGKLLRQRASPMPRSSKIQAAKVKAGVKGLITRQKPVWLVYSLWKIMLGFLAWGKAF